MSKPLKAYNVCSPEKQNLSPGKQNLSSPAGSEKTSGWSRAVVGRRFLGMESSVQRLAVNVLTSVVLCKLSGGVQSASSRRGEITSATRRLLLLLQLCWGFAQLLAWSSLQGPSFSWSGVFCARLADCLEVHHLYIYLYIVPVANIDFLILVYINF